MFATKPNSLSRRLSLMAGGSLAAVWLLAGAGVSAVALTPQSAYAANECGNPNDNGGDTDVFSCTGTFSSISYPATNGAIFLYPDNGMTVTTGGMSVHSQTGDYTAIYDYNITAAGPSITNTSGAGLDVSNVGGAIDMDFSRYSPDAGQISISGTTAGVRLHNSDHPSMWFWTAGNRDEAVTNGSITATNGAGIEAGTTGTAGFISIQNASVVTGTTASIWITAGNELDLINTEGGVLNGRVVFDNTGRVSFDNRGAWNSSGASFLGNGDTYLISRDSGSIATNEDGAASSMDFGGGTNTFINNSTLAVGVGQEGAATLTISGLQTWDNGGAILFGANADRSGSDGVANDRIVVSTPTTFTGLGFSPANGADSPGWSGSKLFMDVAFSGAGQANCSAAVDADCLDLRGSTTAGRTEIVVNDLRGPGSLKPIVLVDVNGGTSADSDFVLSSDSTGWRKAGAEGVIEAGMFDYEFGYDPTTQRHLLIPHPAGGAYAFPTVKAMVNSVWDTTTGHWFNRQADLRDALVGGASGASPGIWLKAANGDVERHIITSTTIAGDELPFDDSYHQTTKGLVGGIDLVNTTDGSNTWVVGLTGGHVKSDATFKVGLGTARLDGNSLGAYASYVSGGLFVDGVVNANHLDLKYSAATGSAKAKTLGGQLETGYRLQINGDAAYLEPLATLSYLSTDIGDLKANDHLIVDYGKGETLRGAVGARLGGKLQMQAFTVGIAFTGRVWDELKGDRKAILNSDGETLSLADARPGVLGDIGATLNLISKDGRLSGFVDYGFKFREGYSDSSASIGVRYNF